MKKKLSIITAALLSAIAFQVHGQAPDWKNYSNFTAVTDVTPVGEHLWVTAKGGVLDLNTSTADETFFRKGDAGLPAASVEQIEFNTTTNTIWVGTYDAGIAVWSGSEWVSYSYPTAFLLYRMKVDGFGDIWLQTDMGLYKFDHIAHTYTFINSVGGAGWSFDAWDFDITPDNHVLIFTGENCLVIDAATNMAIDSFPNSDSPVVLGCSPTTVRVYGVDEDTYLINNSSQLEFQFKDGTYGTADAGLPEFSFINNITRGTDNNLYALVNSAAIYQLIDNTWELVNSMVDDYGNMLLFTDGNTHYMNKGGFYTLPSVIQLDDAKVEYSTQQYNFMSNVISGIVSDASGNIYMSSASNLYTYNAAIDDWDLMYMVPTAYNVMQDLRLYNNVFYTIDYGNLIEYYDGTNWVHIPLAAGYSSIYVYDYDVTAEGVIYFTNDEGLFKSEGGITTNLIETSDYTTWFLSIEYDELRDILWLGRINGIIKYDFVTQDLLNAADVPELAGGLSMQEIEQDADGNIWFGANAGRLYRYDGTDWTVFTTSDASDFVVNIRFMGSKIYCGLTDGDGGLWVYDTEDESEMRFNTTLDAMMPSNNITNFTVLANGDIWMGHGDAGVTELKLFAAPNAITQYAVNPVLVYPNPTAQQITFHVGHAAGNVYQILDLTGKILLSTYEPTINIEQLAGGFYLAKIVNADQEISITKFAVIK